ncbi:MAG: SIR2 family protein [Bacteroidetes bacterium]|nr:SIR2 family protein [Bacteroidota bacterium]
MNHFQDIRDTIKDEMIKSYEEKTLIPFVGAGLSKNIDGFPDWNEFVDILQNKLSNEGIINENDFKRFNNPFEKTEFYVREIGKKECGIHDPVLKEDEFDKVYKIGRKRLLEEIVKTLNPKYNSNAKYDKSNWTLHNILTEKFEKIYTTNWDKVLESANFRKKIKKAEIIKYHGDFEKNKKWIVACETDYLKRMSNDSHLDIRFKNDLIRNDFVFFGYSFRDPNIKFNLYQLGEILFTAKNSYNAKMDIHKIYWVTNEIHDIPNLTLLSSMFNNIRVYPLFDDNKETQITNCCQEKGYMERNKDNCLKCSDYNKMIDKNQKCSYQECLGNGTKEEIINLLKSFKR